MKDFDFISWLNGIMKEKDMNETEMAAFFGISRQAVHHYRKGIRMPMLHTFIQMLEKLGKRMEIKERSFDFWK